MGKRIKKIKVRRRVLIVVALCLGISISLLNLAGTRTKHEFSEVSKSILSTNNYSHFIPSYEPQIYSKNLLIFSACKTNINSYNKMVRDGGFRKASLYEKYWDQFVYDLDNDRVFSVSGPLMHYDVNTGNTLFVRKADTTSLHISLVQDFNRLLSKVKIFGRKIQIPVRLDRSSTQPVFLGLPDEGFKIGGRVKLAKRSRPSGSPDGRYVVFPAIQKRKGKTSGPWVIDMKDGEPVSVPDMLQDEAGISLRNQVFRGGVTWINNTQFIFPLHSIIDGVVDLRRDTIMLLDMDTKSCELLISPEKILVSFDRLGIHINDYRWYHSGSRDGNPILTLEVWGNSVFEKYPVEIDMKTKELKLIEGIIGEKGNRSPAHIDGSQAIETVARNGSSQVYNIRDMTNNNELWSLYANAKSYKKVNIRILNGALILQWGEEVWRCGLDGSNPIPLIPHDAPISGWEEIVSPMSVPESSDEDSNNSYDNKGEIYRAYGVF